MVVAGWGHQSSCEAHQAPYGTRRAQTPGQQVAVVVVVVAVLMAGCGCGLTIKAGGGTGQQVVREMSQEAAMLAKEAAVETAARVVRHTHCVFGSSMACQAI